MDVGYILEIKLTGLLLFLLNFGVRERKAGKMIPRFLGRESG